MKKALILLTTILAFSLFVGCCQSNDNNKIGELSEMEKTFFGDSTVVLIAQKPQNGYKVSIIYNGNLCLCHFERGDSISQYCAIHKLPYELRYYEEDSVGVFSVDIDFPILKLDTIGGTKDTPDMFFMDMNFDDEEEFVVKHDGYNRFYYACFDLVKGNWESSCPGILESTNTPPYNNIVSGIAEQPAYTVFDYEKKEIFIYETIGCCTYNKVWAKYFEGDIYGTAPSVKVVKQVEYESDATGQRIKTYLLENDTLKLVETQFIDFND